MSLNGIELARPDEWYSATSDTRGRFCGYEPITGKPCVLPYHDTLDCLMVHEIAGYLWSYRSRGLVMTGPTRIYFGPSGTVISAGRTEEEAIADAIVELADANYDDWMRRVSGFLDCHPLSPRYAWKAREDKNGDDSAY